MLYPVELRAPYKSIVYSAYRNLYRPMLGSTHTESEVVADYIELSAILNPLLLERGLVPSPRRMLRLAATSSIALSWIAGEANPSARNARQ